jgi:cysteine desulfurase
MRNIEWQIKGAGIRWGSSRLLGLTPVFHPLFPDAIKHVPATVHGRVTQFFFNADKLIVFGNAVCAAHGAGLDLPRSHANNEVGTIEPIAEMARLVKDRQPHAVFHTDAVQAVGPLDINVDRLGVDALSIAAHKLHGPKGVGALYIRTRTPFQPQQLGGGQERNRRAGTENVAGAVGLATAMRLAYEELEQRTGRIRALRDRLLTEVPRLIPGTHVTGPPDPQPRLPNNFSCCFEGVEGEAVLLQLDLAGIAASSGSACTSGSLEPSHVLKAIGVPDDLARGSLRLTVGKDNTPEEIDRLLAVLPGIVQRLRSLSPLAGQQAGRSP